MASEWPLVEHILDETHSGESARWTFTRIGFRLERPSVLTRDCVALERGHSTDSVAIGSDTTFLSY